MDSSVAEQLGTIRGSLGHCSLTAPHRTWGTYYYEDLVTKKQESLHTGDKDEAFRLVAAKNEIDQAPAFSLHLARVYWKAGIPFHFISRNQHLA